jgi:hypothetical protein
MALRDLLAAEINDGRIAAERAAHGQSMTGFSGRHTEIDPRTLYGGIADLPAAPSMPEPIPDDMRARPLLDDPLLTGLRKAEPAKRIRFGANAQRLAFPNRPGFRRYWVNDDPGRVAMAKKGGYAHVMDPEQPGVPMALVTDKTQQGGRRSYLMEIPMEWYQEDMAAAQAERDKAMSDIKYGRAGPGSEDNRYVPKQGIKIQGV